MNIITRKLYKSYPRYINYQNFQSEFNKKFDDIIILLFEKINELYNSIIEKLIESILIVEQKSRHAKLNDIDINVSISVGPINIGISKYVGND